MSSVSFLLKDLLLGVVYYFSTLSLCSLTSSLSLCFLASYTLPIVISLSLTEDEVIIFAMEEGDANKSVIVLLFITSTF